MYLTKTNITLVIKTIREISFVITNAKSSLKSRFYFPFSVCIPVHQSTSLSYKRTNMMAMLLVVCMKFKSLSQEGN